MPLAGKSDDPLPRNAIRLSDAFERYYRATAPDMSAVEAELNAALPGPESQGMWRCDFNWLGCLTDADYNKAAWERWYRAFVAMEESRSRAEKSFRNALATGRPDALVRDPVTGENVKLLNYPIWNEKANFGVAGFTEDFVGPNELMQPGPNTIIGDAMRPVFFDLDDFQLSFGLDQAKSVPVEVVEAASVEVVERWPFPECAPRGRVAELVYAAIKRKWGGGPPKKLSPQEIANVIKIGSAETIRRLLK